MKNNQCNLISNPRKINKKFAKLKVKFWASVFVFLAIISAGGFFIFSGINFKMIAQALSGNYGKTTGGTLTADEWNNLDNDFLSAETDPTVPANIKDGTAWSEISGIPTGFADGTDNEGSNQFNNSCRWICGVKNTFLQCASNEVMKGACGSEDSFCQGNGCTGEDNRHAIKCCQ